MDPAHSPVDALVFDYLRITLTTAVTNLWTWLTIFTAAVSFWRIKTLSVPVSISSCSVQEPSAPLECSPKKPKNEPPSTKTSSKPQPDAPVYTNGDAVSLTKGKFVVYYENELVDDGGRDGKYDEDLYSSVFGEIVSNDGVLDNSWELLLMQKRSVMSWYGFQDPTVLNGNVVRLWDEVRVRRA